MPKRMKSRGRGRRSRSRARGGSRGGSGGSLRDQNAITRVPARFLISAAVSGSGGTATVTETNLTIANLGDRIVNIADTFVYWRMVKLRYTQFIQSGGTSTSTSTVGESYLHASGFIPLSNANYTAPTTITQIVDFPEYSQRNGIQLVRWSVGKNGLIGSMMTKWLTVNTTSDSDVQSAGTITTVSATTFADAGLTATLRGLVEFELEFKGPIDTALVPSSKVVRKGPVTSMKPNRVTELGPGTKIRTLLDETGYVTSSERGEEKKQDKGWSVLPFSAFGH